MKLAILFWCYKEPDVCADRVKLLRHHNPATPIYVLYGGDSQGKEVMANSLSKFVDDFWHFDLDRTPHWKWVKGDRLLARWYEMRGSDLPDWTHLFVAQWDMLIAAPIEQLLHNMPENAAIFTGRLELNQVKQWWGWVRGRKNRLLLTLFRLRLFLIERYFGAIFTAPFIIVSAPRSYFQRLSKTPLGGLGFLEYRCPTFAEAWGYQH